MNTKNLTVALLPLTLIVSGCSTQSAEEKFAESQSVQPMTTAELQQALDGNTALWADGSNVYYNGSEISALNSDGSPLNGTIDFSNNMHCRNWGGGDKCSTVYRVDGDQYTFFVDGKLDSSGGTVQVLEGNPENL